MTASPFASFLAPAKLNISLRVFGKRPDGYHHVRSVMVPVTLYDHVTVEAADEGIEVRVSGDAAVPSDERNACHKAARLFREWAGAPRGVRIDLRKAIPVEAGLGGGSSDAAATLKGLAAVTGADPPPEVLSAIAAAVGADVPFFTLGAPALVEGFGEKVTPLGRTVPFAAVVVKPPFGLPTGEGYRRLGREPGDAPPPAPPPAFRTFRELASSVGNDFEGAWAGERPEIGAIKEELLDAGAAAAGMSGSGSAVFGLFEEEEAARRAGWILAARGGDSPGGGRRTFVARSI